MVSSTRGGKNGAEAPIVDLGSTIGREVQFLQLYCKEHSKLEPNNLRIISRPKIEGRLSYASRQLT